MPTREIKCQTCDEVIGTITKPIITDEDVSLYQQMVRCSNGHQAAALVAPEPPPEN